MSVETISVATVLKYLWVGVFLPAFAFIYNKIENIKDGVYTKVETDILVENKIAPIIVEINQSKEARRENTQAVKELTTLITDLRIELAGRDSSHRTRRNDHNA